MQGATVNPVVARNEIEPLLSALIRELAAQGRTTERAIYSGIRERLRSARDPCELTRPFHDLSAMAYMRRPSSNDADCLLARILEKAEWLSLAANPSPEVH